MAGAQTTPKTRTLLVQIYGMPNTGKAQAAAQIAAELASRGAEVSVLEGRAAYYTELMQTHEEESVRALAKRMLNGTFSSEASLIDAMANQIMWAEEASDFIVTTEPPAQALVYAGELDEFYLKRLEKHAAAAVDGFATLDVLAPAEKGDAARELLESANGTYLVWKEGMAGRIADVAQATRKRVESLMGESKRRPAKGARKTSAPVTDPEHRELGVDMAQRQRENEGEMATREYVNIMIPKNGYAGKPNVIDITVRDEPLVKVRLPYGVPEIQTPEGLVDVSGYTFLSKPSFAKTWPNDSKYVSVGMPKQNAEGEPWEINLMKNRGHWDQDGGKRLWVSDGAPLKLRVRATDLSEAMQAYRDERRERAIDNRARKRLQELGPEKATVVPENASDFDRAVAKRAAELAADPGKNRKAAPEAKRTQAEAPAAKDDAARAAKSAKAQAQQAPNQTRAQSR